MGTPVNRRTVDLSPYPDLVVIYLGMRVNRFTGIKTLFGLARKLLVQSTPIPAAYCYMKISCFPCFHRMSECGNIGETLRLLSRGRDQNLIVFGGNSFCGIQGAQAFGMKPTFCRVEWKPSTTIWS